MNNEVVERIVDACLYEGYILYPYRASAAKNQQRWNFGVLYPREYSLANRGAEPWEMQTQVLAQVDESALLDVRVRFLHLQDRRIETSDRGPVDLLEVDNRSFQTWQEAVESEKRIAGLRLGEHAQVQHQATAVFPAREEFEPIRDSKNQIRGVIHRTRNSLQGTIAVKAENLRDRVYRITVRIQNVTQFQETEGPGRDSALMRSTISTHTILGIAQGEFISLLDPPQELLPDVASCRNIGTWPVLVGGPGSKDCMLSSPIILYDYPEVSAESAGDLFDSTEIDEILTLRILTLTEKEKLEMSRADERARQLLERTETLTPEQLMKLHGTLRALQPVGERNHE